MGSERKATGLRHHLESMYSLGRQASRIHWSQMLNLTSIDINLQNGPRVTASMIVISTKAIALVRLTYYSGPCPLRNSTFPSQITSCTKHTTKACTVQPSSTLHLASLLVIPPVRATNGAESGGRAYNGKGRSGSYSCPTHRTSLMMLVHTWVSP